MLTVLSVCTPNYPILFSCFLVAIRVPVIKCHECHVVEGSLDKIHHDHAAPGHGHATVPSTATTSTSPMPPQSPSPVSTTSASPVSLAGTKFHGKNTLGIPGKSKSGSGIFPCSSFPLFSPFGFQACSLSHAV